MALNKDQEALYRKTMEEAKRQLETIDEEMEEQLQKIREKLAELQESKKSFRQVYEATAKLLGIKIEPEKEENLIEEDKEKETEASEESELSPS